MSLTAVIISRQVGCSPFGLWPCDCPSKARLPKINTFRVNCSK
jgi:hypothetical protein